MNVAVTLLVVVMDMLLSSEFYILIVELTRYFTWDINMYLLSVFEQRQARLVHFLSDIVFSSKVYLAFLQRRCYFELAEF